MEADRLKALIKLLHRHGIEVILGGVRPHRRGSKKGPTIFPIAAWTTKICYICGPTAAIRTSAARATRSTAIVVRNLVLDALRYWVAEYHIDGFRFDLASIWGATPGNPGQSPLLRSLAPTASAGPRDR